MFEALVIAAGVLAATPVLQTDLTLGAGGFSRRTIEDTAGHPQGGLAVLPQVDLSLRSPASAWTLRYAPQLLSTGVTQTGLRNWRGWQELALKGKLAWSARLELNAELDAGYGRNEQLKEVRPDRPFDALDLLRPVIDHDVDCTLDLGGSYQLAPLDRIDLAAGYFARGGTTRATREVEPFQTGPELYLGYEHALSEIETLGATFYGASSTTGDSGRSSDGRLELAWGRSLSHTVRTRITAGASASFGDSHERHAVAPAGSAELDWLWPSRQGPSGLSLVAAYAPRMDPITGERGLRAEVSASLTQALTAEWALRSHAGFAREPGVANFALGGGDLVYRGRGGWSFALEAEAVHQARGGDQETFLRVFSRAAYALKDVL